MSAGVLPEAVQVDGAPWRVARAWPADDEATTVELTADGEPSVRVGVWRAGGLHVDPPGSDRRLPALADWAPRGDVVSHRRGRRAVVRVAGGSAFVKIVRPGRAEGVRSAHERAAPFATSFRMATASASGDDLERGVVRFTAVPGRTLHDLGADAALPDAAWEAAWDAFGSAWEAALTAAGDPVAGALGIHTPADEARVLAEWAEKGAAQLPAHADLLRRRAGDLGERLTSLPPASPTLAHRDLHDKQLLWDGHSTGLLDVDTVCLADPALDLGNLRAHAAFRVRQGWWSGSRAVAVERVVDRLAARRGIDPGRLALAAAATTLRLACVYAYRPRWRALAADMAATVYTESG